MGRIIILCILIGIALANPAPAIGPSSPVNSLQTATDSVKEDKETGRSDPSLEDIIEEYIKSEEFSLDVPIIGSTVTLGAKSLDNDQLDLKLRFGSGSEVQARKKSKIKKIVVPILVFLLIKAMTLIPLALGVLGIKTWNAIQLSFISFISALVMAVWKLCSKVNHEPPQIIHNAWDPHHHHLHHDRSDDQQMAYSGYTPQQ